MRLTASLRTLLALALVIAGFAAAAGADEIRLKNGDRLTGKVVSLEKGVLKFDTGHGALDLPWADVVGLAVTDPILVTMSGRPVQTVTIVAGDNGQIVLQPGGAVVLTEVVGFARPEPPLKITGGANAGILKTSGNTDVSSLRLDGEVVARAAANRYSASGIVNRTSDRGAETARNSTAALRYDRFFSKRLYANASGIFTNDKFRDLDLRTALGLGLGYQVADNTRFKIGVEGGYGYVSEHYALSPDNSYHALRETLSADAFVGAKRLVLFHRNDLYYGVTGNDNFFIQTRNGARVALAAGLVATLQYDVDYTQSPAPGRKNSDQAVGFTFGYRF
jgi:putative salt-induced outer membrane protein YdiY